MRLRWHHEASWDEKRRAKPYHSREYPQILSLSFVWMGAVFVVFEVSESFSICITCPLMSHPRSMGVEGESAFTRPLFINLACPKHWTSLPIAFGGDINRQEGHLHLMHASKSHSTSRLWHNICVSRYMSVLVVCNKLGPMPSRPIASVHAKLLKEKTVVKNMIWNNLFFSFPFPPFYIASPWWLPTPMAMLSCLPPIMAHGQFPTNYLPLW
jgi:hypothetical protein